MIGNPPWGGGLDNDLDALKKAYPDATSEHTDSFKIFVDLSLRLCNSNACGSLIIPNTILRQKRLKDVRTLILKKQIIAIVDLGENIFETVIAPSCIILIKNKTVENSQLQYNDISKWPRIKKEELLKKLDRNSLIYQNYFNSNQDKEFIRPILSFSVPVISFGNFDHFTLKDVGLQCQRVNVGKEARTKSDLAQRIFVKERIGAEPVMYWKGRDFEKYYIKPNTDRYFRKDFKNFIKSNEIVYFNETVYNSSPKLLIRQTSDKIIAAVDLNRRWFDGSVIGLIPTKESDYDILYILGLFNSTLFRWCYQEIVNEEGRAFAQVKLSKVKQLPIRKINFSDRYERKIHNSITSIVSYIIFVKTQFLNSLSDQLTSTFEQVLDGVIYEAYFPEIL
ncbi:MAG: type restriction endonuclease, partial [Segetibacter sp.]|nr:type restriction endonuclease [Segetibacter sp.]